MKYYGQLYTPQKEINVPHNSAKDLFKILRHYSRYFGQPYMITIRRDHIYGPIILIYKMIDDILEISHLPQNYKEEENKP